MKVEPKIYYGLHFCVGVAEYSNSERIYIQEATAKKMDATFPGKPVYVEHVDNHDDTPDGYVVESFFNPFDGMHWAKFIVTTEEGQQKIRDGWRLSNAYFVAEKGEGGKNHNVDYAYEVLDASYDHLAIVQVPRYEESVIMEPEAFKAYNDQKKNALEKLKNSKDEKEVEKDSNTVYDKEKKKNSKGVQIMFSFFKKEKVENSEEVKNLVVTLKNGQEMTVEKLVEMANKKNEDEEEEKKKEEEKKNQEEEEAKKLKEEEEKKKNEEDEKKKKEEEEEEAKKNEIKNAMERALVSEQKVIHVDQVARGKTLYGSK